jgi:hypothetical protein
MTKLCEKYGDKGVMRFRLPFENPRFMIYKPEVCAEWFDWFGEKMTERNLSTQGLSLEEFTGYSRDILMGSGEYWKTARKVFVKGILKSLGRTLPILDKRLKEATRSIKKESEKSAVHVGDILSFQTFGVIADMSVGRVPMKDQVVKELISTMKKMNPYLDITCPRNLIPGYRYLPWDDEYKTLLKKRDAILESVIHEHKKTLDSENPEDFLDSLKVERFHLRLVCFIFSWIHLWEELILLQILWNL